MAQYLISFKEFPFWLKFYLLIKRKLTLPNKLISTRSENATIKKLLNCRTTTSVCLTEYEIDRNRNNDKILMHKEGSISANKTAPEKNKTNKTAPEF